MSLAASDTGLTAQASSSCGGWLNIVPPDSPSLLSVDFSGTTWMAVGTGGDVEVSSDASTWTWHYSGFYKTLSAVRYFNSRFVVVGEGGLIIWSVDGHTWSQPGSPTSNELRALAVGANRIVAVGRAGTILWSSDGAAWSFAQSATAADIFAVAYFQGRFFAIDAEGWVLDSADGVGWQKRGFLPAFPQYGSVMGMGASNGLLVAVGYDVTLAAPGGGVIYTTTDGSAWVKQTPPVPTLRMAAFGADQWVAVGDSVIVQSANGISWNQVPSPLSDRIWDVAWGANKFVAVGWAGIAVSSCSAAPAPIANFSWSPASPRAGQGVQFADLSTGSPASWSWNFGDGTTSTASNPFHTYSSAGTRSVTLTVSNGTGTNSVTKQVSIAAAATLPVANFTWSPQNPVAGQTVQFTDLSTSSPQAWSWNFASQNVSGLQNPSHTFQAAGSFLVTLIVTNGAGNSSVAKTVTVSSAPSASSYWLPAVIHKDVPSRNSWWRSDIAVLNRSSQSANLTLRMYAPSGLKTMTIPVAGKAQLLLRDVAGQLGVSADSGTLQVVSDQAILLTGRTYNQIDATHTYGQDYDGQESSLMLGAGQSAWLPQLTQNALFRTNIGITNTGESSASVTLTLFDSQGNQVSSLPLNLAPSQFYQFDQPYLNTAAGGTDNGYAVVTVNSGSGIVAYASVIDQATGDPTTFNMKR